MMPTMFTVPAISGKADTLLPGIRPQPAAAFPQPGATQADKLLLPIAMPYLTEGDVSEPPAQDSVDVTSAESDPQQLLALLLAAPITLPPAEEVVPVSTQAAVQAMSADSPCGLAETESAGLLRNSVLAETESAGPLRNRVLAETESAGLLRNSFLAAGHLRTAIPWQVKEQTPSAAVVPLSSEPGDVLAMLQNVPKKLQMPADALRASQSVQQVLQADRELLITNNTLQHPAPALLNALLKGDAEAKTLPAITLPAASEQKADVLQKALAERLEMQIDRRVQKATIRLDPPNLGKLDISIHFESGKLQVQIQAAQPEVTRLLQQISNDMRTSLSEQNNVQVNVQVSTQNGDSRQQHRHRDNPETAIDNNNEEVTTIPRGTDGTILTMV
ncbi:flagellar hook-length control protein FliK [Erwinia rhapontici]|uniref:flagellar hook-length control protein FliK n=1 Tax=Erwinia rhapontici TaxID=55212 RepID=UPI003B9F790A